MGVVRDDPAAPRGSVSARLPTADVVITTGGVSVGEADFVKQLMAKLGEVLFWKIAMRPGRPMAFGKIGDAFLFGLPGNPVAVMVTFYQFVRDALLHLSGRERRADSAVESAFGESLRKVPGRTEYQRGILFKRRRRVESAHHRPAGLGRAALDVGGELLHRPRARARHGEGRRSGAACSCSKGWPSGRARR